MLTDCKSKSMPPNDCTNLNKTVASSNCEETSSTTNLDDVESELVHGLPRLNNLTETGLLTPDQFVDEIARPLEIIRSAMSSTIGQRTSVLQQAFKLIGFLVCSAERHLQDSGCPKGTIWQRFPAIEQLMAILAASLGLPPNLSTPGYWLQDRRGKALTFTGTKAEKSFKECVQVWDACCRVASDAIRPICQGKLSPDSNDAISRLKRAIKCYAAIGSKYKELMPSPSSGRPGLTIETFKFRNYLCSYPVEGRQFTAANAANLQSNFSADVLLGVSDKTYVNRINERLQYLSPYEREILLADLDLPSIVDRYLTCLGIRETELLSVETTTIAVLISRQPATFLTSLAIYKRLYRAICSLSGKHWGSIKSILIGPAAKMSEEEKARMTVSPDRSVGDADHQRPEEIFRMRKENAVVNKLLDAFDLVASPKSQSMRAA